MVRYRALLEIVSYWQDFLETANFSGASYFACVLMDSEGGELSIFLKISLIFFAELVVVTHR